jgi:hypothetical protein
MLILLGALVFLNRVYLGGVNRGIGSILGNPPLVIIPAAAAGGGGGGGATAPGGGGGGPGGGGGSPGGEPPDGGSAPAQPLLGITAETNLPILGPRTIPLRVGESSGNNRRVTIPLPRARVTATVSRHPICDLVKCTTDVTRRTSGNSGHILLRWRQKPVKVKDHVPPGQSLAHALNRAIHSLLR